MILLAGADIVLPARVVSSGCLLIDADRIVAVEEKVIDTPSGATRIDIPNTIVVPGFVDVHVHGVEGHDVLDGAGSIAQVARRLPKYGVTSFCPTSVACDPVTLRAMLAEVDALRAAPAGLGARVLPAHLESNFINPDYKGAQPLACLRSPRPEPGHEAQRQRHEVDHYVASDILGAIAAHAASVGIVTMAPELDGGIDLVRQLAANGHRVSLGHSAATYEQAVESVAAGVCHATHLFNRMTPMTHRAPGAPGAVLQSEGVVAELICDGFHVHPAMLHMAIRTKGARGIMAITDGTAGSGLAVGARTRLGGRAIIVTARTAELEDGTLAGSVLTMDGAFRTLVHQTGVSIVDAASMCATTPARQMKLADIGRIEVGAIADLAVLDRGFRVAATYLAGQPWRNTTPAPFV
ncbi:MAG: N-acetylglucosamine-6-phosphate deacetylase [Acidobacteria bacterium]|nr:N-acetylglucosamine-6-phosphate deacetylase [Acidobacteriota bacterium]